MVLSILLGVLAAAPAAGAAADPSIPHLRRQGTAAQLVVDGKPFLIRGGELGNSTASNPAYLRAVLAEVRRAQPEHGPRARLLGPARAGGGAVRLRERRPADRTTRARAGCGSCCCGSARGRTACPATRRRG